MNDKEFERLLAAAYEEPLAESEATALTERVIREARSYGRLRRALLAGATFVGVAVAAWIVDSTVSLSTVWALVSIFLQDIVQSIHDLRPEPTLVLCLILSVLAGVRALRTS